MATSLWEILRDFIAKGSGSPGINSRRLQQSSNSKKVRHNNRNYQKSQKAYARKDGRQKHGPLYTSRLPAGYSWDQLTRTIVTPYPKLDEETRQRVQSATGKSVEELYEGLTRVIDSAVDEFTEGTRVRNSTKRYHR